MPGQVIRILYHQQRRWNAELDTNPDLELSGTTKALLEVDIPNLIAGEDQNSLVSRAQGWQHHHRSNHGYYNMSFEQLDENAGFVLIPVLGHYKSQLVNTFCAPCLLVLLDVLRGCCVFF